MKTAPAASIRYAMALTFLWFGIRQLQVPADFVGFLPEWVGGLPMSQETFVKFNGWFEIIFATFLAIGFETRIAAFLLGLHLMGIVSDAGVHGMLEHLYGILRQAKEDGVNEVFIHAFTDGRDTPPNSGSVFTAKYRSPSTEYTAPARRRSSTASDTRSIDSTTPM